ncbi:transmembrane channel-like protein 8 [Bombina bombina]|uniref:transmembrane channel-like protein 8 n=1 Tax=Bombina bombina TaxID=8345 RepID=UPI00235A7703|nr:transmembrane channel-like protein 8 [Bombina bombina]XP_053562028.1 transmembrane channel-like protein 8 [Bombina bombina]
MDQWSEKGSLRWRSKVKNGNLRELPVCLQEKRLLREKWQTVDPDITYWRSWTRKQGTLLRPILQRGQLILSAFKLWERTISGISGRFGSGICSYFLFLRFLILLNLMSLTLTGGFLIIPILFSEKEVNMDQPDLPCRRILPPRNMSAWSFFTAEGYLENSFMFYGFYSERKMPFSWLNISHVYLLIPLIYLLLCGLSLLRHTMHGVTLRQVWSGGYRTRISSKVFAGWDSCVRGTEASVRKQQSLSNEFKSYLAEELWFMNISGLSGRRKLHIIVTRALLNCIILTLMAGGFYSIHLATSKSQDYQGSVGDPVFSFMTQYLSPIVISLVLMILPPIFKLLVRFEGQSPSDEITLTLIRCVFLRLGTLAIFLFSLGQKILCLGSSESYCTTCGYNTNYECWETTVGQEFYKLSMFHFINELASFLLLQLPRWFLVSRYQYFIFPCIGQETFQVSQNVLDVVYGQTLVWGGLFYAPLLPLLNVIFIWITFYIKKFTLYRLCGVSQQLFRASSSKIFFHFVLFLGLMTIFLPLIYMVTSARPSHSCGLFTNYTTAWEAVQNSARATLHPVFLAVLDIISSDLFAYVLLIILSILLTSFVSRVRQYEEAIDKMKDYLSYQIEDKIFLVHRLQEEQEFQDQNSSSSEIPTETACEQHDNPIKTSCESFEIHTEASFDNLSTPVESCNWNECPPEAPCD